MNKGTTYYWFFGFLLFAGLIFSSCEKEVEVPGTKMTNPFLEEDLWNGFVIQDEKYETPNAIIEIWGENLDSLSSDFDIHLTDGIFNIQQRSVQEYSVKLYFDLNSPSLSRLSDGVYIYENTSARKPNNIVEAYIEIHSDGRIIKYPVLEGEVHIESSGLFFKANYTILTMVNRSEEFIEGQFTGSVVLIDQRH